MQRNLAKVTWQLRGKAGPRPRIPSPECLLPHQGADNMVLGNSEIQSVLLHTKTNRQVDRRSLGRTHSTRGLLLAEALCHLIHLWTHRSSPCISPDQQPTIPPRPRSHQGHVGTHLLVRWSLGETPFSPKRVMKTFASVPAPRTSPVAVTTSYTGGEKKTDCRLTRILHGLEEAIAPANSARDTQPQRSL